MASEAPVLARARTLVLGDELARDGSILVLASLLGGGVNYLYQVLVGRLLGPEQYGVFGSLFALSYLLLILSWGVAFVSTKYVSELVGAERAGFMRGTFLRVGVLTGALFLGLAAASPLVAGFLRLADPLLVVLVGLTVLVGPLNAVNRGALRGLERFVTLGSVQVGTAAVKLLVGVGLVLVGFGVFGAIAGIVVATLLSLTAVGVLLRRWYLSGGSYGGFDGVYRFALPSLLVAFCFTVPTNADVVIVKHLFSAHQAGLYTSVSVFGKVLVFLPVGIAGAMFPKAAKRETEGEATMGLLRRALLYTGLLAGGAAAVLVVLPDLFLGLLYGGAYVGAAGLLRWYAPAMAAFSLCVVMLQYSLAVDDLRFVRAFAVMTVVEIGLLYLVGASPWHLVAVLLLVNGAAAAVGWLLLGPMAGDQAPSGAAITEGVLSDD